MSLATKVRKLMLSHNQLTCDTLAPVADIDALEMLRVAANRLEVGLVGNSGLGVSEKCIYSVQID